MTIRTQGILVTVAFVVFLLMLAATTASAEVVRVDNSTFSEDPACNPDPDDFRVREDGGGNSSGTKSTPTGLRIPPDAPCATIGNRWDWQKIRRRRTSHPDVTSLADSYFAGPDGIYNTADDEGNSYAGHWVWEHIAIETLSDPVVPWELRADNPLAVNNGIAYGYGVQHAINSRTHHQSPRGNWRGPILVEFDTPWDAVQIVLEVLCGEVDSPGHCPGQFRTARVLFWDANSNKIGFRLVRHDIGDPKEKTITFMGDAGEQVSSFQVDSPGGQATQIRHLRVGTATTGTVIPDREIVWSRAEQHPDIDADMCFGTVPAERCVNLGYPTYQRDTFSDPSIHMDRNGNSLHAGGCAWVPIWDEVADDYLRDPITGERLWEERCHPIYDAQGFQVAELDPLDDLIPPGSPTMCVEPWPGDLDGDGCTGGPDFALFVSYFGTCRP